MLAHERALVEVSSRISHSFGSFDSHGVFSLENRAYLPQAVFEQNLQIMTRITDLLMPFIHLPVVIKKGKSNVGGGFSDMTLGARSSILADGRFPYLPSIAMVNGMKIPTGQKSSQADPKASLDITSQGQWQFFLGLLLEKEISALTYGLSYSLLIESARLGHSFSMGTSFLLHEDGFLTLVLSPIFLGPITHDGVRIKGSDQRKLSMSASYALKLNSKLRLIINAGSDLPIGHLGKDFDSEFFIKMALRLGVF